MAAVAEHGGMNLQSNAVMRATGISASSMKKSLEALIAKEILRQTESGGRVVYRFEDPFLPHWVRFFVVTR
jgi:DNA-binding IclR family transcriptional regulator